MISVLIPTLGNRPNFLEFALKQIHRQTMRPDEIVIIDDPMPAGMTKDITWRYQEGLKRVKGDFVLFWEDDDWYCKNYIETMFDAWNHHDKPDLIGFSNTTYYHIMHKRYLPMSHPGRSSCFCTGARVKAFENFQFGDPQDPWFDMRIWEKLKGEALPVFGKVLGIKHGLGLVGGAAHNRDKAYNHDDPRGKWLKHYVGAEDYEFYQKIARERLP